MDKIIGHIKVKTELENLVNKGNVGHAYIFCGVDGIGKSIMAEYFAKAILCENNDFGKPCNSCESCKTFGVSSDYYLVEPENDSIKVDQIRAMSDEVFLLPTISSKKVFVINDADTMNESAQNALLKILEEPPAYAVIILVVSNKEKILKTILSRTTAINFLPLSNDEIKQIFFDEEVNEEVLLLASGSAGKYQKLCSSDYIDDVIEFETILSSSNLLELNETFTRFKKDKTVKENIDDILDLLVVKLGNNLKVNPTKAIKFINIVEEIRTNLKKNANFETQLDYFAIRIWETNK